MAIYHFHVKPVQRSQGQSSVAAAAYRSGTRIVDHTTGIVHDYRGKTGVAHTEILAPENAPAWMLDRETLWNTIEAIELRKDSQPARDVEIGLPIELSKAQQIALLRDFVTREFVSRGMVADIGMHLDNPNNPHAHILLSTRHIVGEGFGKKNTSWNRTDELIAWRRGWAEATNEHLAQAGLGVRVDHRSYREQQIELIPGRKIGVGVDRRTDEKLPGYLGDRIAEQRAIASVNGAQIIAEPAIALKALTHSQATFSHQDVARFLHTRTSDAEQFQAAYLKVTTAPEIVGLGVDEKGLQRFTTQEMLGQERGLLSDAERLANRMGHGVTDSRRSGVLSQHRLSEEQVAAVTHVTGRGDLKSLVGVAGSGKSTALSAMRQVWEADGYQVKGAALAGIAAENLEVAAGIHSRTIASYELAWSKGRDGLSDRDILVLDEAGMIGTRQLARVLSVAKEAGAKVVLVGDPEQLQAIEAGAPFRGVAARHGVAELTQVRRQKTAWQREATADLAAGRTARALEAYAKKGGVVGIGSKDEARRALLARWASDAIVEPKASQLVLAYTRDDVKALNTAIRTLRQQQGLLGASQEIATEQGTKAFAVHDRIRFLRNDKTLGVKNGSLGTIERISGKELVVKLDGDEKRRLAVDTKFYAYLDHGYAATVHKAQGTTVDRAYVLASSHFDRHTTYVAMSRHRVQATLFYAKDDFNAGGRVGDFDVQARMTAALSRVRQKDLVHDYLQGPGLMERQPEAAAEVKAPSAREGRPAAQVDKSSTAELFSKPKDPAAQAAENWRRMREARPDKGQTVEDTQRQARENWLKFREQVLSSDKAAQQRALVAMEFERLAKQRAAHQERVEDWKATPQKLREAIDRFNQVSAENQKEMSKRILLRPEIAQAFEQLLVERQAGIREQQRSHDRDWGPGLER